jgi:hypothetical protein
MSKKVLVLAFLACGVCPFVAAQSDAHPRNGDFNDLKPSEIMTAIFSEFLVIPFPQGFVVASERTRLRP